VEITSEVADHANSIILDQVENGVAIRMAVLYLLAAVFHVSLFETTPGALPSGVSLADYL
jgi:hypothetical protein